MMIRRVCIGVLLCVLVGCGSMNLEDFEGSTPAFRPESYFLGSAQAWGMFQDRFGKIRREFTVSIDGSMDGDILVLDENFVYADGETDQRVWRITKVGDDTYEGRADDIVGIATGRAVGRALRWRYAFDLPMGDNTIRVTFDDWMFQQDERVMINRSTISKFGVELGQVHIFFLRDEPQSDRSSESAVEPAEQATEQR